MDKKCEYCTRTKETNHACLEQIAFVESLLNKSNTQRMEDEMAFRSLQNRNVEEADKWKALAGELVEVMRTVREGFRQNLQYSAFSVGGHPVEWLLDNALAKAKEAGIDTGGKNG